jgi:hypothetical protein
MRSSLANLCLFGAPRSIANCAIGTRFGVDPRSAEWVHI